MVSSLAHRVAVRHLIAGSKLLQLFEPVFKTHDDYIKAVVEREADILLEHAQQVYSSPKSRYGLEKVFKAAKVTPPKFGLILVLLDTYVDKIGLSKFKEEVQWWRDYSIGEEATSARPDAAKRPQGWKITYDNDVLLEYAWEKNLTPAAPKEVFAAVQSFGWEGLHDKAVFNEIVKRAQDESIALNRIKLSGALNRNLGGLEVKSVKVEKSRVGTQGIEGVYELTLEDGTRGYISSKSIGAGGWNIQRFHFRYLMKVSPELKARNEAGAAAAPVDPAIEAVFKILGQHKRDIGKNEYGRVQIGQEAVWAVEGLKGSSRNWGPVMKAKLVFRSEEGHWAVKRWNYFLTAKGEELLKQF